MVVLIYPPSLWCFVLYGLVFLCSCQSAFSNKMKTSSLLSLVATITAAAAQQPAYGQCTFSKYAIIFSKANSNKPRRWGGVDGFHELCVRV